MRTTLWTGGAARRQITGSGLLRERGLLCDCAGACATRQQDAGGMLAPCVDCVLRLLPCRLLPPQAPAPGPAHAHQGVVTGGVSRFHPYLARFCSTCTLKGTAPRGGLDHAAGGMADANGGRGPAGRGRAATVGAAAPGQRRGRPPGWRRSIRTACLLARCALRGGSAGKAGAMGGAQAPAGGATHHSAGRQASGHNPTAQVGNDVPLINSNIAAQQGTQPSMVAPQHAATPALLQRPTCEVNVLPELVSARTAHSAALATAQSRQAVPQLLGEAELGGRGEAAASGQVGARASAWGTVPIFGCHRGVSAYGFNFTTPERSATKPLRCARRRLRPLEHL